MTKFPTPKDNTCTGCGHEGLTLAMETTEYAQATFDGGKWGFGDVTDTMPGGTGPDDVRLFCAECGRYFEVPEGIV